MPRVLLTPEQVKINNDASKKRYERTPKGQEVRKKIASKYYAENKEEIKRKRRERYARKKAEKIALALQSAS